MMLNSGPERCSGWLSGCALSAALAAAAQLKVGFVVSLLVDCRVIC